MKIAMNNCSAVDIKGTQQVRCLVFLRTDSIGDSLLSEPMIEHIYQFFGRPRIIVVCQQASAPLYRRNPWVAGVIEIPNEHKWENAEKYGQFIRQLKAEKPDMLLNPTYSVHEISDLPGLDFIPRRVAFRNSCLATYTHLLDPGPEKMPELKRHARFLEQVGMDPVPEILPRMVVPDEDMGWAGNFFERHELDPGKTIILFASSRVAIKDYRHWGEVLEPVCRKYGSKVVALGAEKDREFADLQLAPLREGGINACGRTSLFQAAALIKQAALAAGCDTSLAHIACAVGTPNVVVAGGGHPGRFLPYSPLTSVVCRPLDCFDCRWKCKYSRPHCLEDIAPRLVGQAVEDNLTEKSRERPRIYFPAPDKDHAGGKPCPVECKAVLPDGLDVELVRLEGRPKLERQCEKRPAVEEKRRVEPAPVSRPGRHELPLISVVTACLNQAGFIEDCMRSVLDQDYPYIEYIVMDGASSDGSAEIIKKYSHRLAYWQSRPDGGQYAAIMEGFRHARGQIMTWLNADDVFYPGTFSAVAAVFVKRPQVEWITGLPNSLNPDGKEVFVLPSLPLWSRSRYLEKKYFTPFIQQEGTFWRRSLWDKAGGYLRHDMEMAADLELWTRFFRHALLHSVDFTLALFRQHPGQKTDNNMHLYFREAENILNAEIERQNKESLPLPPAPVPISYDQVQSYLAETGLHNPRCDAAERCPPTGLKRTDGDGAAGAEVVPEGSQSPEAKDGGILVSALVSTCNAERFIEGCLEDLLRQTIAGRLEIIVVDSGSRQDEARIVKRYQQHHADIRYLRTEQRESVYQAWNRALGLARGRYVTNANTDDRHRRDAFEQMVKVLEDNQEIALVYADVLVTDRPCAGFDDCRPTGFLRWYDWDRQLLLDKGCFIGPQPMWRRKMHEFFGLFDTSYKVAADYEFWLRISQVFDFHHLDRPMGVYLERDDSVEHANTELKRREELLIVEKYRQARARRVLLGCPLLKGLAANEQPSLGEVEEKLFMLRQMAELANCSTPSLAVLERLADRKMASGPRWRAALRQTEIELLKGGKQMYSEKELLEGIEAMTGAGKTEAARWALEKMIQDCPGSAVAHFNLAVLAFDAKDMEQARESFETAASLAADNFVIQKQLADFYYVGAGDPEKALEQYGIAVRLKPDDRETLITMAHLNVSLERFDQARQYYLKALELEPDNHELRQILAKLEGRSRAGNRAAQCPSSAQGPEQLYKQAREKIGAGRRDEAFAILERITREYPEFAPAHNDLGVLSYEAGDKEAARDYYRKAVELAPESPIFHKNLADFYLLEDGQVKEAMEHYLRAMTLDPTDIETLMATGNVCLMMNKAEDACTFFERVLEMEPWHEEARRLLDRCARQPEREQIGQPARDVHNSGEEQVTEEPQLNAAIASLEQKLSRFPDDATAHNDLGVLYYEAGRKEQALEHYQKAVRLAPHQATFRKNLADYYFMELNQPRKAMEIYTDLLKNDPRDAETLAALGQMCRMMGKYDDARQFLGRALELEPGNQNLLRAVNQLEDQVAAMAGQGSGIRLAAS